MNTSPFDPCVWQLLHSLDRTTHLLRIAQRHLSADGAPSHSALLAARLAPDMLPLARQVQIACDQAKNGAARLIGQPYDQRAATDAALGKAFSAPLAVQVISCTPSV